MPTVVTHCIRMSDWPHPPLRISPANLNMNISLFLFINVITVCPQYLHACHIEWSVCAE